MKVLIDTSVWVAHFKLRDERLVALLSDGVVLCHPFVIEEVACGTPPNRRSVIQMLSDLERAVVATHEELMAMLELHQLYAKGCGVVDLSLLASTLLSEHTQLLTLDARLKTLATSMGRAYRQNLAH